MYFFEVRMLLCRCSCIMAALPQIHIRRLRPQRCLPDAVLPPRTFPQASTYDLRETRRQESLEEICATPRFQTSHNRFHTPSPPQSSLEKRRNPDLDHPALTTPPTTIPCRLPPTTLRLHHGDRTRCAISGRTSWSLFACTHHRQSYVCWHFQVH